MPTLVTPWASQPLDDGDLVLRFSKPAAVIVERHRAADCAGGLGDRLDAPGFRFDARGPFLRVGRLRCRRP